MANEITAIKCPQCGSTKHERIVKNHYQCVSCGSEYLIEIDNDDININLTYENKSPQIEEYVPNDEIIEIKATKEEAPSGTPTTSNSNTNSSCLIGCLVFFLILGISIILIFIIR